MIEKAAVLTKKINMRDEFIWIIHLNVGLDGAISNKFYWEM